MLILTVSVGINNIVIAPKHVGNLINHRYEINRIFYIEILYKLFYTGRFNI